MEIKQLFVVSTVVILTLAGHSAKAQDANSPVVRIADLEIDPAQMEAYSAAVKVEMATSIRVEPGVLALYAVSIKDKPNHLRFFEMYADNAAYEAHRDSAHFKT
ncbi:antibiotic biosynthesis monooxygenase (plasmid) [Agrobacterium fabrum]|uniref:putative quinol monooxygenase n=1 Tax=Rhizobium/Agrobacterium group TaxID=227290 RepID=UPI000B227D5E|nr:MULTISPECIES: antibiotic biosynthesis monooxygenase [Rhizobium/Agrobacterium group]WJK78408.1 antibiotic biosynthesis monooxygenase [Agrobacterium fabrum]